MFGMSRKHLMLICAGNRRRCRGHSGRIFALNCRECGRQFGKRADNPIGVQRRDRYFAIAEIDRNDRHIRSTRRAHIGPGIAHQDRKSVV